MKVTLKTRKATAKGCLNGVSFFTRSAWGRGVKEYAFELIDTIEDEDAFSNRRMLEKALLNGASNWSEYSWGGCSLIYDGDIAERLCTPSELKKTRNGERKPNHSEEWLDTQARALSQASRIILNSVFCD